MNAEPEELILSLAYHVARLEREYRDLQHRVSSGSFEGMLGTSPQIQEIFGAIPESLLESELFGHEKGAFTGATRSPLENRDGTLIIGKISEPDVPSSAVDIMTNGK